MKDHTIADRRCWLFDRVDAAQKKRLARTEDSDGGVAWESGAYSAFPCVRVAIPNARMNIVPIIADVLIFVAPKGSLDVD